MNNNKIEKENEQSEFTNHEEEVCMPAYLELSSCCFLTLNNQVRAAPLGVSTF